LFDNIRDFAKHFLALSHRIADLPFLHRNPGGWQLHCGHINDEIELLWLNFLQALGKTLAQVDILLGHYLLGERIDTGCRPHTGAFRGDHIRAVLIRKTFGHRTAAGISNTQK